MSLAGNTYWNTAKKNTATSETWLIQLYYDTESSFIGLSGKTLSIDSNTYHGLAIDFGTISNSIDIAKSTSDTDSVTVIVSNNYKNGFLSSELFGGSRKYINRKVNIYSRFGDTTSLSDCQLIDTYRLYNIKQLSGGRLSLHLEKKSPIDHISIPQEKYKDTYFPVVYGDYQAKGGDTVTSSNLLEGNDGDMSDTSSHRWEADGSDPPTFWDINSTVSGKLYIALTASDLMGIRLSEDAIFDPNKTYDISFKGRTASGSGAKLYIGGHPSDGSGNPMIQATTGTETTYTGTFEVGTTDTHLYLFAVADVGTASQAFEVDDISITVSATDTITDEKKLFPATYIGDSVSSSYRFGVGTSAASGAEPYLYDSSSDSFQKMTDGSTATVALSGGNYISFDSLDREIIIRPISVSSVDASTQDEGNMYDGDITTYGYIPQSFSQGSSTPLNKSITFDFPDIPENDTLNVKLYVKAALELVSYTESSANFSNWDAGMGAATASMNITGIDDGTLPDYKGVVVKTYGFGDTFEHEEGAPSYGSVTLTTQIDFTHLSGTYSGQVNFRVYDVYLTLDVNPDYSSTSDPTAIETRRVIWDSTSKRFNSVRPRRRSSSLQTQDQFEEARASVICSDIDGLTQSYTGGSGLAENVHEVYRDLLARFVGFDVSDANMAGWSALDTARSDWAVRWWQHEPKLLKSILDQLQYEGCFIFKFYGQGGKFIFVKDDPTSDSVHTIGINDIDQSNIKTSLSDFYELITKTEYNWHRHPAKGGYIEQSTYTNSTARTNWWASIASEENVESLGLDFLVKDPSTGSSPNDCIALYYNNIVADPKILVQCTITNKDMLNLETGDIIQFDSESIPSNSNRSAVAYGKDFADLYFMITKTRRTIGELRIEAREVYSI